MKKIPILKFIFTIAALAVSNMALAINYLPMNFIATNETKTNTMQVSFALTQGSSDVNEFYGDANPTINNIQPGDTIPLIGQLTMYNNAFKALTGNLNVEFTATINGYEPVNITVPVPILTAWGNQSGTFPIQQFTNPDSTVGCQFTADVSSNQPEIKISCQTGDDLRVHS